MIKKQITGFLSVFSIIATLFSNFVLLEKYIYADAYKEYPEFTNNTIWIFLIFAFIGLIITALKLKSKKGYSFSKTGSIGFMLLGANQLLIGIFNLYNIQTVLNLVKVNSITFIISLVYMCFVAFTGIYIWFAFLGAVSLAQKDLGKMIISSFLVLSLIALLCPNVLSYPLFIIIISVVLFVCAFLVTENSNETALTKQNSKNKITIFGVSEFLFMMVGAAYIKTAPYYNGAEKIIDNYAFSFVLPALLSAILFFILKSIKNENIPFVVSTIVFAIGAIFTGLYKDNVIVFTICYTAAMCGWFVNIAFAFEYIFKNCSHIKAIVVVAFVILLPSVIGYVVAVVATKGFGYLNDVFSAIYLEPLRTNAEINKGLIENADGEIEAYKGIGEVIKLTYRRNLHIASPIVAYACGSMSLIASLIGCFLSKIKSK